MLVAYRASNIDQINLISITQLSADQLFRTNDPDTKGQVKGVANIYLASGKNVDLKSNHAVMHSSAKINQEAKCCAFISKWNVAMSEDVGECHPKNILCQFIKKREKTQENVLSIFSHLDYSCNKEKPNSRYHTAHFQAMVQSSKKKPN